MPEATVTHFFTVDVEEYFQVGAFEHVIARDEWQRWPSRAEPSLMRLLELLARHDVKATCFVLGCFAERHPTLVRALVDAGHEIASHGWSHRSLVGLSPRAVRTELRASRDRLEQIAAVPVVGFRAPNFSIVPGLDWVFDLLLEEGYAYDSSLFAYRRRPASGYPGACTTPHRLGRAGGTLLEIPIAVRGWAGVPVPAAGGAYFRHLPYLVTRRAFARATRRGTPSVFYIHPWELDPDQPRVNVSAATRLRHYGGIRRTAPRLERLLSEFSFTSIARHPSLRGNRAHIPTVVVDSPVPAA
jgi:polysaccharide deacetylase family protein (PEP-CTERM system associated)